MSTSQKSSNFMRISRRNLVIAGFLVVALAYLIHHPLPDDFEQPWKYRFIKFNVELASIYVNNHYLYKHANLS